MDTPLIVILGPTASGKTRLAVHVAWKIGGEIISADSRQVYRGMDIGTGKDLNEYTVDGRAIPCHLIDIRDPGYEYNVFEFQQDFRTAHDNIAARGLTPVLCGGTGLYLESVLSGYRMPLLAPDPGLDKLLDSLPDHELETILRSHKRLHNITDLADRSRLMKAVRIVLLESGQDAGSISRKADNAMVFGIATDRDILRERITERLNSRLGNGMVEEVRRLLDGGLSPQTLIKYGLEYRYITRYLTGELSYNEMVSKLNIAIHQFAKRQLSWFRRMERKGIAIRWIDSSLSLQEKTEIIVSFIRKGFRE